MATGPDYLKELLDERHEQVMRGLRENREATEALRRDFNGRVGKLEDRAHAAERRVAMLEGGTARPARTGAIAGTIGAFVGGAGTAILQRIFGQ